MNLAVSVSTSSSTVNSPIASESLGILKAPCRTDWSSTGKLDAKEYNRDAASSSQGWRKDAFLDVGTRNLVASGNSETEGSDKIWPHNLHISIHRLRVAHGEGFLDCEKEIWSQSDRSNEELRWEHNHMGYIYVCHSSSCSSSWHRLQIYDLPRINP